MLKRRQEEKIPEPDLKQKFLSNMVKYKDYSITGEYFKKEMESLRKYSPETLKSLQLLNARKNEIKKNIESIKQEIGDEKSINDLLFKKDYISTQIERSKNLQNDLKKITTEIDTIRKNKVLNKHYREKLAQTIKRFFRISGKIGKRSIVIPIKNNVTQKDIDDLNTIKKDNMSNKIVDILKDNRDIIVQKNDEDIINYLKANDYYFKNQEEEFYAGYCYNEKNTKIKIVDELKKIKNNVKNIESKKNILAKMDPKLSQYQVIGKEIKKLSLFKDEYLKRMEIIENQSEDLENIDNIHVVVLSWIPRHVMSQSTATIWQSCMTFEYFDKSKEGINKRYVATGIGEGVFIAWYVKLSDLKKMEVPKARILIKPFIDEDDDSTIIWWPSKIYQDGSFSGMDSIMFKRTVKNYCLAKQRDIKFGALNVENDEIEDGKELVYPDDGDLTGYVDELDYLIDNNKFGDHGEFGELISATKTFEEIAEQKPDAIHSLFFSVGFNNKKMFDFLESKPDRYFLNPTVLDRLLKISYMTNNLFFFDYALKKVEKNKDAVEFRTKKMENIILENSPFNNKLASYYFDYLKDRIGKKEGFSLQIISDFIFNVLTKITDNYNNSLAFRIIDFILNEKLLNYFLAFSNNFEIEKRLIKEQNLLYVYSFLNKAQKKEMNSFFLKNYFEKSDIFLDKEILNQFIVFVKMFKDENREFFSQMEKILDRYVTTKNSDDFFKVLDKKDAGNKYIYEKMIKQFYQNMNNDFLKLTIDNYKKLETEQKEKISTNFKNNMTYFYLKNMDKLDKKLVDELKQFGIISHEMVRIHNISVWPSDKMYNLNFETMINLLKDEEMFFQFLKDKNSKEISETINTIDTEYLRKDKKIDVDIAKIFLKIDKKFPEKKIFSREGFLSVYYSKQNSVNSSITHVFINEEIIKNMLKSDFTEEDIIKILYKNIYITNQEGETICSMLLEVFRGKKIKTLKMSVEENMSFFSNLAKIYGMTRKELFDREGIFSIIDEKLLFKMLERYCLQIYSERDMNRQHADLYPLKMFFLSPIYLQHAINDEMLNMIKASNVIRNVFIQFFTTYYFSYLTIDINNLGNSYEAFKQNITKKENSSMSKSSKEFFASIFENEMKPDNLSFSFSVSKKMVNIIKGEERVNEMDVTIFYQSLIVLKYFFNFNSKKFNNSNYPRLLEKIVNYKKIDKENELKKIYDFLK